jgi:hypothetical protein
MRLSKTSSSLTCVMITECSNHDIAIENIDLGILDHKAQILYQRLDEPVTRVICKDKWLFTQENRDHFNLTLKEEQRESVYTTDDINIAYQRFLGILYCYFNTAFPLERFHIRNKSN